MDNKSISHSVSPECHTSGRDYKTPIGAVFERHVIDCIGKPYMLKDWFNVLFRRKNTIIIFLSLF